jgi:hypothetical protein
VVSHFRVSVFRVEVGEAREFSVKLGKSKFVFKAADSAQRDQLFELWYLGYLVRVPVMTLTGQLGGIGRFVVPSALSPNVLSRKCHGKNGKS